MPNKHFAWGNQAFLSWNFTRKSVCTSEPKRHTKLCYSSNKLIINLSLSIDNFHCYHCTLIIVFIDSLTTAIDCHIRLHIEDGLCSAAFRFLSIYLISNYPHDINRLLYHSNESYNTKYIFIDLYRSVISQLQFYITSHAWADAKHFRITKKTLYGTDVENSLLLLSNLLVIMRFLLRNCQASMEYADIRLIKSS